jgi:hypothetical protein
LKIFLSTALPINLPSSAMGDPVTALSEDLSSRVDELLRNSSPFELFSQSKIDHKLLQKAKYVNFKLTGPTEPLKFQDEAVEPVAERSTNYF